ncbi:MBL fold metallo-hydrolase [Tepiditoga spiralis]|uniref:MBL fold metallo-hydrolase n=1 Tax=Tepiditoga spiralis TaxID=2108365 RepID=A0A7G1G7C6_9BACT|nr:FprA family A-type flavoprotein [Tepiditoga spiralis]BBE31246.1 MBL fold metallo-hydrolase [Tepiditoga spiralis]
MDGTRSIKLENGVYWNGILNPLLRVFDVIMKTEYGTSYNSYLVKGKEKYAVIDGSHDKFIDLYMEKLSNLINGDFSKIEYIIVNHTEPDHSGAIFKLLELNPNITIVSTAPAKKFLEEIVNGPFNHLLATEDLEIDLGGKTLNFIMSPYWHWPDTMFTYLKEDKMLFTCDGFGAHFADERMFIDKLDEKTYAKYLEAMFYYYVHIMGPFKENTRKTLEKIKNLDIKTLAPSHGPIHRGEFINKHIDLYKEWAKKDEHGIPRVLILYVSAYGNTEKLAKAMAEGIKEAGGEVELFDMVEVPENEKLDVLVSKQEWADGILYGSPTINNDALMYIWEAIGLLAVVNERKNKVYSAFGSYGWSGEAVKFLTERLKMMRLKTFEDIPPIKVKFYPTEEDLKNSKEYGKSFLEFIRKNKK